MRLDLPYLKERFGGLLFYRLQSVYELDSGLTQDEAPMTKEATQRFPYEVLHKQLQTMAIVVPVREEKLKLLDGVLAGIPHPCQVIIVSNSSRKPYDRFRMESDLAQTFSSYTNRRIIVVHQQDPELAAAFAQAGYPEILDGDFVRSGKAEGMMIGMLLAKLAGCKTVGFVDSDNYFPGAVLEYCHLYAAGFAMAKGHDYTMVRIAWQSKPKIVESNLYFAKWGRSSVITNQYLNQLVSHYTGFETEAIRTGNAGEHAMDVELALQLAYTTGYSIEPYQIVYLMEEFGGVGQPHNPNIAQKMVDIYQLESRNPHLHEYKGEEHVERMIEASLSVIYQSSLTPPNLKQEILQDLIQRKVLKEGESLKQLSPYPPLAKLDLETFKAALDWETKYFIGR
jgi:mannosyl-3-phosphoglycerate synthase